MDLAFKATVLRAVEAFVEEEEIIKPTMDDSNRQFRTRFVCVWLLVNAILALTITRLGTQVQSRYFSAILWITFGLSAIRISGMVWYLFGEYSERNVFRTFALGADLLSQSSGWRGSAAGDASEVERPLCYTTDIVFSFISHLQPVVVESLSPKKVWRSWIELRDDTTPPTPQSPTPAPSYDASPCAPSSSCRPSIRSSPRFERPSPSPHAQTCSPPHPIHPKRPCYPRP